MRFSLALAGPKYKTTAAWSTTLCLSKPPPPDSQFYLGHAEIPHINGILSSFRKKKKIISASEYFQVVMYFQTRVKNGWWREIKLLFLSNRHSHLVAQHFRGQFLAVMVLLTQNDSISSHRKKLELFCVVFFCFPAVLCFMSKELLQRHNVRLKFWIPEYPSKQQCYWMAGTEGKKRERQRERRNKE